MHIQTHKQTSYFTSYNTINNGPIMGCKDHYDDFSKYIPIFIWESEKLISNEINEHMWLWNSVHLKLQWWLR